MRRPWIIALLLLVVAGTGCGESGSDDGSDLVVVATTSVIGDLVGELVGDEAIVEVLIDGSQDPHDYSPSAAHMGLIDSADLVVANGLGLEAGLADLLSGSGPDTEVLQLAELVDPIPFGDHAEADEDAGDDHAGEDPHFWLDASRMARAATLVAAALDRVAPDPVWAERGSALEARLLELDAEIEATLAAIPPGNRRLVTNHDALGYFAERYDFEVIATVIPGGSTLAEPSAADLADLVRTLAAHDIRAIFADTSSPRLLAETVAAELGDSVRIYDLYTGGLGVPGSGAGTYAGMMRANAATLVEALAG
jgi:zinc/manganese transport system substrate-binding protein